MNNTRSVTLAMVIIAIAAVAFRIAFAQTEPTIPPDLLAAIEKDSKTDELLKDCIEVLGAPHLKDYLGGEPFDLGRRHKAWQVSTGQPCSGAQNGPHFVYIRVGNGWRMIAEEIGIGFSVCTTNPPCRPAGAHGWPDLMLEQHGTAYSSTLYVYRFDGRMYKLVRQVSGSPPQR